MRAVKSSPGPFGAASLKDVFSPGLELNGFFFGFPRRTLDDMACASSGPHGTRTQQGFGVIGCPVRRGSYGCFFVSHSATVLRTLASTPVCGGAEGKRISSTQGERLREGCAPSDKRPDRLTIGRGRDVLPGSINKAAQHIKGKTPMWTTCE